MVGKEEIAVAQRLFEEGWSGGKPVAACRFLTEDVVLRDVLSGAEAIRGWANVDSFWEGASGTLKVPVEDIFVSTSGVSLTWVAYAQLADDSDGPENRGKWRVGEGMSRLEFRDGKVCLQVNYWNGSQGIVADWKTHWETRRQMTATERGAATGAS